MKKVLFSICVMLFAILQTNAQQTVVISRGPFLQMATQTSIKILWRTNIPTDSRVAFGTASSLLSQQQVDAKLVTEHEVTVTGLKPDTQYYYSIGSTTQTERYGVDYYFRTLPPKGSADRKYTFWMVGDAGDSSDNQRNVRNEYFKYMKNKAADAMVLLGDNAYDISNETNYQNKFFSAYQNFTLKNTLLIPALGNHEYLDPNWNAECCSVPYFQIFTNPKNAESGGVASGNEGYYAYDYGNVHFVILDSYGVYGGKKLYDTTNNMQVEWLKKDIAANQLPWTVLVMHHPPHTKRSHDSDIDADLILLRQNLNPIIERLKIDLVVSGHSHLYERYHKMLGHYGHSSTFSIAKHVPVNTTALYNGSANSCPYTSTEGTMYIVAGSAGRNNGFADRVPHPAAISSIAGTGGSLVLEVEGNRLTGKWISASGSIMDTFTQFKNLTKSSKFNMAYGQAVELKASWDAGEYKWTNNATTRIVSATLTKDTTMKVTDTKGCLEETFSFVVAPQPELSITPITNLVCTGLEKQAVFAVTNTSITDKNYDLILSDAKGNFDNGTIIAKGTQSPITFKLPDSLSAGTYQLKIKSDFPWFLYKNQIAIDVKRSPAGTISGDGTIRLTEKTTINLTLDGTPPIDYILTGGITGQVAESKSLKIDVAPLATTTYQISTLKSICGERAGTGSAKITVLPPLAVEEKAPCELCVYPNPVITSIEVEVSASSKNSQISVVDMQGRQLMSIQNKSKHQFDLSTLPAGKYLIVYKDEQKQLNRQIIKE